MKGQVHELPTPPEVRDAARATRSSQAEVDGLLARPMPPLPTQRYLLLRPALVGAVVGALLTLLVVLAPGRERTPEIASFPVGSDLVLDGGPVVALGPSVGLNGLGRVSVRQAEIDRTIVSVASGAVRFVFHPAEAGHELRVLAGDVEVQVTGTIFEVQRLDDAVRVWVEEGRVLVHHRGSSQPVLAGESWSYAPPEPDEVPDRVEPAAPAPGAEPEAATEPEPPPPDPAGLAFRALREGFAAGEDASPLLDRVDAFLVQWPTTVHDHEARVLAVDLAQRVEAAPLVIARIDDLLQRYPESVHRAGLVSLRARLAAPSEPEPG